MHRLERNTLQSLKFCFVFFVGIHGSEEGVEEREYVFMHLVVPEVVLFIE